MPTCVVLALLVTAQENLGLQGNNDAKGTCGFSAPYSSISRPIRMQWRVKVSVAITS